MLKETNDFYDKTVIPKGFEAQEPKEAPITHVKVFHKEYPRFPSIKLPEIDRKDSEYESLLSLRESTRVFSDIPICLEEVSKVLGSCRIVDINRDPEKRTYPSGGARFPVEVYLAVYNVKELEKGAYHYNMVNGTLEYILDRDLVKEKRDLISPFLENPAATVLFTSVIPRAEVKYGLRAYPYSLIEAGHMAQNIQLACAEIGLGACSVSGIVDEVVKEVLDLTDDEIPIYSTSFGRIK